MDKNNPPILFLAHGSPMNAVEDNPFTRTLRRLGENLPRPKAVCCVSAHWYGDGTFVSAAKNPETIHDFGGFPEELYRVQYPAPGHPDLARRTAGLLGCPVSEDRGLDHGAWSVLRHLFPKADIPVYQVSLDATLPAERHFQMGRQLSMLQKEGVLLAGSGNVVHNLRKLDWNGDAKPFDWALAFDDAFKGHLSSGRYQALIRYEGLPRSEDAVPTPDHYLPFLWMLGAAQDARPSYIYEGFQNGSLSMRSIRFEG